MRAQEFITEKRADPKLCNSTRKLGNSAESSCKSQGLRPRTSKGKGHTMGDGTGRHIKGKKIKGRKYGGPLPDQS